VPYPIATGVGHVIIGVAWLTVTHHGCCRRRVIGAPSVGVKVTDKVWPAPAFRTIPAAGVYANVPGTLAVALSCVALSAVP